MLGSPITHSLSPAMHRAAYVDLGLDWTYDAVELTEDSLPGFLAGLDDTWRGLSVTAPLKRALVGLLDDVSDDAAFLGVANTVVIGEQRVGFNTDVPGAVGALREAGLTTVGSARILGGGATAASMLLALGRLGLQEVEVVVRDVARAAEVVDVARRCGIAATTTSFGPGPRADVDVLVSTVPAAAVDPGHALTSRYVFDAVYDPWPTPLASAAADRGVPVVSGLDLLAHQAALQVHLMTGCTVRPALLRDAALGALTGR
ncbi:putative shikimate dehydrogenase [Aeromicrobium marinum DSM 15272]|uniref:Shikimate dehydrogenase n=1 Tax=Aeromicrobium marinum DSM 15272 TaxID=585531 RepID=E2S9F7_9ACTN|nr:putative shikimate dehydrogenase [Aeromicrobium marinum DSM 15272]